MTTIDPEHLPIAPPPQDWAAVREDPKVWIRRNLFRSPIDAIITVVAAVVVAYVLFRLGKFVFVSGRWRIVRVNLNLFMVGRYPRTHLWRIVACGLGLSFFFGVAVGNGIQVQRLEFGRPDRITPRQRVFDVLRRVWPLLVGAGLLLAMTTTVWPTIFLVAIAAAFVAGRVLADRVPDRYIVWLVITAVIAAGVFVWFPNGAFKVVLVCLLIAAAAVGAVAFPVPPAPLVFVVGGAAVGRVLVGGRELLGTPLMVVLIVAVAAATTLAIARVREVPRSVAFWLAVGAIPLSVSAIRLLTRATGWDGWGGMMMNLFLAVAGISLCFPLGILLALGRRAGRPAGSASGGIISACILAGPVVLIVVLHGIDFGEMTTRVLVGLALVLAVAGYFGGTRSSLPVMRVLSVGYIELIRGCPLFVLLLVSAFSFGFFVPEDFDRPGFVVRAIVVFTLFTAAYIAEIVRGGLQSLPKGQVEAAQALGLTPVKTTGLIVLPQALRNVIPAIVGQFISLLKDTTLAGAAIGLFEIFQVSDAAVNQPGFDGQGLTPETVTFGMFVFWIFCITMSRESQRLERKLGVGTR